MSDTGARDVNTDRTFTEFVGTKTETVVLADRQLEERGKRARAQLRSLPLLTTFGLDTVVHADVYDNGLRLADYDLLTSHDTDPADVSLPCVHVATQEGIDEYDEEELVRRLTERSVEGEGVYVLVTDTVAPRTPTYTPKPGKAITDEFDVVVKSYETLSKRYLDDVDTTLAQSTTRNVFFHEAAAHHRAAGLNPRSLEELFAYDRAPADSPVWDPLAYFLEDDLENVLEDYSERIREALRSWTEKGEVTTVANQMLETLRRVDFELDRLTDYRELPREHR
ncbi:hypothetical protein RYH80_20015 [Halobaculum sp. MBLA0147]|uniref:hypothetical protein n=1 Tax=Halobaculum sp. MBLA0147 TaxID=3079934 RepID=UPI0035261FD0